MKIRGLGKLRWPWHAVVVTPAERALLVMATAMTPHVGRGSDDSR